jgi:hypothetical protein
MLVMHPATAAGDYLLAGRSSGAAGLQLFAVRAAAGALVNHFRK